MMSSLSNKKQLMDALISYEFDVLLFSGGGNDIVGEWDFDFFLNEKKDGMSWKECINEKRLARRVDQIKNAYLDLLDYTFAYARSKATIKVVTHTYDYPIPDEKGVLGGKSWMWPYLMQKKIYDPTDQIEIAKHAIGKFAAMLGDIESSANGRFKAVNTCGLVRPNEWANEIHPSTEGFKKVTDKIYVEALK